MAVKTTTDIAPAVSPYYDRNLLENARPNLIFEQFGQMRPLPQRNSKLIRFRRPNTLAAQTTALVEGITPTGSSFSYTAVNATVKQYGDFISVSDLVSLTSQDPVITDITSEQGHQAGLTIDTLRRDILVAGTNVNYSGSVTSRETVVEVMDQGDIEDVIRTMYNANAAMINQKITAGKGISTEPVSPGYIGICHPDIVPTIEGCADFIPARKYAVQGPLFINEFGAVKNVRFMWTTQGKIWAGGGTTGGSNVKETSSSADVYATLILARNAYGIVPLDGKALEHIFRALGSSGTSDPLNQKQTSGWKANTTTVILNENFLTRIESAATDVL